MKYVTIQCRTEPDDGRRWPVDVSAAHPEPERHATVILRAMLVYEGEPISKIVAITEHEEERHESRAEDGDAAPVIGCSECEAAFPSYFDEMRQARREYDAHVSRGERYSIESHTWDYREDPAGRDE